MANITYTDRYHLGKHDPGYVGWAEGMNANLNAIDDVLGLVLADASDTTPGPLSQKVDGDTLVVDTTAHKIKVVPVAIAQKLYAVDGGSTNALTVNPTPAWSAYAAGQFLWVKVANTNTGAATINVSGLGVKSIKNADGSDLGANLLYGGGIHMLCYNGTHFQRIA
ncbi:MAG: hypothetical protein HQL74_05850 [Magnetococcales bacterium]|nr:hypothetical protein [Magnetococcales bacterium]